VSAGVALYVMLSGDFPFKRPGDEAVPKVRRLGAAGQRAAITTFGHIQSAPAPLR
jgi:hypothetical protein